MTTVEPPNDDRYWDYAVSFPQANPTETWVVDEHRPELGPTLPIINDPQIEQRILRTLKLVGERGYGLSLKRLSKGLLGGPVDIDQIKRTVEISNKVITDGAFVCVPGQGDVSKCHARKKSNRLLHRVYLKIAREYAADLSKLCPWVECIMLSGSAASGGIARGDDLDFDIVAKDGTKFITYLLALALGLKYSIKNKALFEERYFGFLPKVVCVNVVWERRQVLPFVRQDEQVAYELVVSKVLYNRRFYSKMVNHNLWLNEYFPQFFDRSSQTRGPVNDHGPKSSWKRPRIINTIASKLLQAMYRIVKLSRKNEQEKLQRMEFVEEKKRPYGLFDD